MRTTNHDALPAGMPSNQAGRLGRAVNKCTLERQHASSPTQRVPSLSPQTANPCAGKKDGTLVAAGSCSATYYQCWQGQPVSPSPQCAAPLVFNPKAKPAGCSFAGALGTSCDCTAYYSGEDLAACNVCKVRQGNKTFSW